MKCILEDVLNQFRKNNPSNVILSIETKFLPLCSCLAGAWPVFLIPVALTTILAALGLPYLTAIIHYAIAFGGGIPFGSLVAILMSLGELDILFILIFISMNVYLQSIQIPDKHETDTNKWACFHSKEEQPRSMPYPSFCYFILMFYLQICMFKCLSKCLIFVFAFSVLCKYAGHVQLNRWVNEWVE